MEETPQQPTDCGHGADGLHFLTSVQNRYTQCPSSYIDTPEQPLTSGKSFATGVQGEQSRVCGCASGTHLTACSPVGPCCAADLFKVCIRLIQKKEQHEIRAACSAPFRERKAARESKGVGQASQMLSMSALVRPRSCSAMSSCSFLGSR